MKNKIAIAIDEDVLKKVDETIDNSKIRSRSQAIEVLIRKGLEIFGIDTAVLLLSKEHQKVSEKPYGKTCLINEQKKFFTKHGIDKIYVAVQDGSSFVSIDGVEMICTSSSGNAGSMKALKPKLKRDFIAMSGDTYINFDLSRMIRSHISHGRIATIGLMSHKQPCSHGIVRMDGNLVTEFKEKPKKPETNIINAGIYIFSPVVFNFIEKKTDSIEEDVLPRLVKIRQLIGHFTMGEFAHLG